MSESKETVDEFKARLIEAINHTKRTTDRLKENRKVSYNMLHQPFDI